MAKRHQAKGFHWVPGFGLVLESCYKGGPWIVGWESVRAKDWMSVFCGHFMVLDFKIRL